jgi:hypothetical protein
MPDDMQVSRSLEPEMLDKQSRLFGKTLYGETGFISSDICSPGTALVVGDATVIPGQFFNKRFPVPARDSPAVDEKNCRLSMSGRVCFSAVLVIEAAAVGIKITHSV